MRALPLFWILCCFLFGSSHATADTDRSQLRSIIDNAVRPVIEQYDVPGMAIAVTKDGERYFYHAGVMSRETRHPITSNTLFELGSISKTFTATLATYAQQDGKLSLDDKISKHLPALSGSSFEHISLLNLATHTAGGLPLQVPDDIRSNDQLMNYLRQWRPAFGAGTHRSYSNISIGLLGVVAAASMRLPFEDAIEKKLFPGLGMTHSYIRVPADRTQHYAQGYTRKDAPVRLNPGVLASEAYGVKSSAADMIRFIEANMQMLALDPKLQRALTDTHAGYFKAGDMTQDLIWEQYPYPIDLKQVLSGNSDAMVYESTPVTSLNGSMPLATNVMINKTGSTNGFAAYVAFIPAKKLGIVMLANKNYPAAARVTAAYRILTALDKQMTGAR
ncbi:class C beta-lactamase [Herbaspirillum sp. GCM10030257]|uniref:class C beta-lactamase n=1 Tax=Herbaspirillum sp. GCM10030257 TaxID=3273393 RepID=UPI003611A68A